MMALVFVLESACLTANLFDNMLPHDISADIALPHCPIFALRRYFSFVEKADNLRETFNLDRKI
jgi:hypothetical protein